jgi:hypothetical protein
MLQPGDEIIRSADTLDDDEYASDADATPCKVVETSLGGGFICAECGSHCDCVVCAA